MAKIFNTLPKFPEVLKKNARFVLWRYENVDGRKTKIPYSTNGSRAQSNNPATFSDFDIAESKLEFSRAEPIKYDGIGIGIFGNLCGIDIDHCIDTGGKFSDESLQIIDAINGYTEYSPSRNGVHILFYAPRLADAIARATGRQCSSPEELKDAFSERWKFRTKSGLEFYARFTPRYFTATGDRIREGNLQEDKTDRLLSVLDRFFARPAQEMQPQQAASGSLSLTDRELIDKARTAANGTDFAALWSGDTSKYNGDDSRADLALMSHLAYWTGGDASRMDSLFRQSGLCRDKWTQRADYRKWTIDAALKNCRNFYSPTYNRSSAAADFPQKVQAQQAQPEDVPQKSPKELKAEYMAGTADKSIPAFFNDLQEKAATPAIPTGFSELDRVLDGGLYEGLYIIGGISSIGKTTFCLQMADQIAAAGQDVLIFSLEMSKYELIARSLSRHTFQAIRAEHEGEEYNAEDYRDAKTARGITAFNRWKKYSQAEIKLITDAAQRYGEFGGRVWITEGLGSTGVTDTKDHEGKVTEGIRSIVEKHVAYTGRVPVVLVDYLQILEPYSDRMTDKQNTDKSVKLLKIMSRDFKAAVIAISSFNRQNYKSAVDMEAFKESGAIEYSSDVLIGLQLFGAGFKDFIPINEKKRTPRRVQACILKNRNGPTGGVINLYYYAMFNCFEETLDHFKACGNNVEVQAISQASGVSIQALEQAEQDAEDAAQITMTDAAGRAKSKRAKKRNKAK